MAGPGDVSCSAPPGPAGLETGAEIECLAPVATHERLVGSSGRQAAVCRLALSSALSASRTVRS